MTDLLDTIHDLQREVKALKAIGDTSTALTASVQFAEASYADVPAIDETDVSHDTNWIRYPGTSILSIDFQTASNTMAVIDISGQAEVRAFGTVNARYAVFWRVKKGNTIIADYDNLGTNANQQLVGAANLAALGGGWTSTTINNVTTYTRIGGGVSGPLRVSRIVKDLQPHTIYTIEAYPAYAIHPYDVNRGAHNEYYVSPISTDIRVTNITGETLY